MKLYIVRHGESEGNAAKLHQASNAILSPAGIKQAGFIAKRFKNIEIDIILASPFQRAKQTAEIIGQEIGKQINLEVLFVELKRPSEIIGKSSEDPEIIAIRDNIRANWHDPNWRYSDEETFFELRKRAVLGLKQVTERKEEKILLVSHGFFIAMLFSVMVFGEELEAREYKLLLKMMHMKNTGLTICEFKDGRWKLVTWNDHAHLGE